MNSSLRLVYWIGFWASSKHVCVFGLYGAMQVFSKIILTTLYLVVSLAWWD